MNTPKSIIQTLQAGNNRPTIAEKAVPIDPGLQFPGRTVLYVHECASRLRVAPQHIIDLIEEGALAALDVGGNGGTVRVPPHFLTVVAERSGRTEGQIRELLDRVRAENPRKRASWRIPIAGWNAFLERRNTLIHPV